MLLLTGLIVFAGCSDDDADIEYVLAWSDEFDGPAGNPPDPEKWTYDIGRGNNGWGNAELQYYTDRTENAALDGDGHLVITAIEESFGSADYTSARLKTQNIFSQRYGRFEARIKLPRGQGIWPAFWMLGDDIRIVGWPQCGEIDVMEYLGQDADTVYGTVHGPGFSAGQSIGESFSLPNSDFDVDFHVFAVEWTETRIIWSVDGDVFHVVTPQTQGLDEWVFDDPFFMILNVAVGGYWPGEPDASTRFPQTMEIDWVRVYRAN